MGLTDIVILLILIGIFLFIRIGLMFYLRTHIYLKNSTRSVRIKYSQFKNLYNMMPEKYSIAKPGSELGPCVVAEINDDNYYIFFRTFSEWIATKIMFYREDLRKEKRIQMRNKAQFLKQMSIMIEKEAKKEKMLGTER